MLRIRSICFIVLLLLDGAASVLAKENDDQKTLQVTGGEACFKYGNGIKFTAIYSESALGGGTKSFDILVGGCPLSFNWGSQMFEFKRSKECYVVINDGSNVFVEITGRVKMKAGNGNGKNREYEGTNSCEMDFKEGSNVTVKVSGCPNCQGLKLEFDNDVCRAEDDSKKSTPGPGKAEEDGKNSGLSNPVLVLIILGSITLLVLIFIAVALLVFLYIMPRYSRDYSSSSSSSSSRRSDRTKGSTRSSMQGVVIAGKPKKGYVPQMPKKAPVLKTAINKSPKKTQKKPDQRQQQLSQIKKKHASSPVSTKKQVE